MSADAKITVEDVGPVTEFEYEPQYGLNVIVGPHNSGKSTILRTVELITTGDTSEKPSKQRGAASGVAAVGGKRLKFMKQVRASGDLGLDTLGDLDIVSLHRPKFDSRQVRDVHRTACLVRLAGIEGGESMFADLPDFASVTDGVELSDDLVTAAGQVKRAYQKAARDVEEQSQRAFADQDAAMEHCRDVDLNASDDVEALAKEHQAKTADLEVIKQAISDADEVATKAERAQKWFEENPKPDASPEEIQECLDLNEKRIDELQEKMQQLQVWLDETREQRSKLKDELQASSRYKSESAECQAAVDRAAEFERPTEEQREAAESAVEAAWKSLLNAQNITKAKQAKESARSHGQRGKELEKEAAAIRETAAKAGDVLVGAVSTIPGCPIKAAFDEDGNVELKVLDESGKLVLFDEQSDGTRWKIILPMCMGKDRMIVIPQAAYGELSEETRQLIHDEALQRQCYVLTGQVTNSGTDLAGYLYSELAA